MVVQIFVLWIAYALFPLDIYLIFHVSCAVCYTMALWWYWHNLESDISLAEVVLGFQTKRHKEGVLRTGNPMLCITNTIKYASLSILHIHILSSWSSNAKYKLFSPWGGWQYISLLFLSSTQRLSSWAIVPWCWSLLRCLGWCLRVTMDNKCKNVSTKVHMENITTFCFVLYFSQYVGCMEVRESMKSLDFETRTAVAK